MQDQESVLALDEDCFLWKTMERWEFLVLLP